MKDIAGTYGRGDATNLPSSIIGISYLKESGNVYADIRIQHPYPPMSSCGPTCFQSTVRKKLDVHAPSFTVLSQRAGVAVDRNGVVISGMRKGEELTDKTPVKLLGGRASAEGSGRELLGGLRNDYDLFDADPATLSVLDAGYYTYYFKDRRSVYYMYNRLEGADPATFVNLDGGYSRDARHVYYYAQQLKGADAATFEHLDELGDYGYAKDKGQVYHNGAVLPRYHAPSFEMIKVFYTNDGGYPDTGKYYLYAKDRNGVYANGERIPHADPESFVMVYTMYKFDTLNLYAKDKNHVYVGSEVLEGADPATFVEEFDEKRGLVYYHDAKRYYRDGMLLDIAAENATYGEEYELGSGYTANKRHVYYNGKLLNNAHYESFEVLADGYAKDRRSYYYRGYTTDEVPDFSQPKPQPQAKNPDAYYYGSPVEGADLDTYVRLSTDFGKDKNRGYFMGKPIEGSDGATFRHITYYLSRDDKYLYNRSVRVEGADPDGQYKYYEKKSQTDASVTSIHTWIVIGKDNVWYDGKPLSLDPATFRVDGSEYFCDKNNVLYRTSHNPPVFTPVKGVDVESFVSLKDYYSKEAKEDGERPYKDILRSRYRNIEGYGKDRNHVYYEGVRLPGSHPSTFTFLGNRYAKDKNNVYYEGKIVEGADPATFKNIDPDGYEWMDKSDTYYNGKKRTEQKVGFR